MEAKEHFISAAQKSIADKGEGDEHDAEIYAYCIADIDEKLGNLSSAVQFYSKALEIQSRTLGVDHPESLASAEKIRELNKEL